MALSDLIGRTLGRYHILEQLGEGGMAAVYRARDLRLERDVAVKIILPGKEHSLQFSKRFEREAKALAQLSHPNIVRVLDYGEQDEIPYLVMEYIPGGTLKNYIRNRKLGWREAVRLLLPIANALAYAHQHKIIHRDVKPANILLSDTGQLLLSDFGIAKLLENEETLELTGTGVGIGTPEYMAPEQGMGSADERSDIYSLGVVFYEMVTGRRPYEANTPMAVLLKKAREPLPRPTQYVPDLPGKVETILIKSLAYDPNNRYPDMPALALALENLQTGGPATVSPLNQATVADSLPLVSPPLAAPARKGWPLAWIVGGFSLVALCAVGISLALAWKLFSTPAAGISPQAGATVEPVATFRAEGTPTARPTATRSIPTAPPTEIPVPTKSSDGWIAYQSNAQGNYDLYMVRIGGLEGTRLTTSSAHDMYPNWSPDGTQLVYQTNEGGDFELAVIDIKTRKTRILTSNSCDDFGPVWSPDGKWLVFHSNCDGEKDSREIYKIRVDGSGRQQLTKSSGQNNWHPSWSPDGQMITFSSNRTGKYFIYTMRADGSNVQELARGCISYYSPDGSMILYGVYCDDTDALWLMNADGSNPHTITSGHECKNATWAPDSRRIVFQESPNGIKGPFGIFIMDISNPDDANWKTLLDYQQEAGAPVWQP